jgi:hypothetical protein
MNPEDISDIAKEGTRGFANISQIIKDGLEPYNIIRKTKAESKAELIKNASLLGITIDELKALKKQATKALIEDHNIYEVINKANNNTKISDDKVQLLSNDWLHKFINYASCVSDEEIQQLWANILSGEIKAPGTYSLQTLNILSMLDKKMAASIQKLFLFSGYIEDKIILFYDTSYDYPTKYKLNYEDLLDIETLGIIKLSTGNDKFLVYLISDTNDFTISLGIDKIKILEAKEKLFTGSIILTRIGMQIYKLNKNQKRSPELNLEIKKYLKKINPKLTILECNISTK